MFRVVSASVLHRRSSQTAHFYIRRRRSAVVHSPGSEYGQVLAGVKRAFEHVFKGCNAKVVMQPCEEAGLHSYLETGLGAVASAGISRRRDGMDSCMLGREGSGVAEHGKRTGRKDAATKQDL
jgi:hypothetical protein